jgi:luciferase family oxidoreductase group 1
LGFAFAHHINPGGAEIATRMYQEQFTPSEFLRKPRTIVAVSVVCADTDEQAAALDATKGLMWVRTQLGHPGPVPSPEEAQSYQYTATERAIAQSMSARSIIGTPATVKEKLDQLIERTHADELMITGFFYGHENRVHNLELLSDAFGLDKRIE